MMLKRVFDPASLSELAKSMGVVPRLTHHAVIHTGFAPEQNWDDQWVERGIAEGWMARSGDRLALKTDGESLHYTIKRGPGYFCKSTGEAIPQTPSAWFKFRLAGDSRESRAAALAWLAANGKTPDDYGISVQYECVLDADQHARYRAVRNGAANVVAAHTIAQGA